MHIKKSKILLMFLLFFVVFDSTPAKKEYVKNKITDGDTPLVKFNRITLPLFTSGQIGNAIGVHEKYIGTIDTIAFLYTSGFFMSGYDVNGNLWTNGVDQSRKILDYVTGTVSNPNDTVGVYTNSINSTPFGEEWQNWKNAVLLGAEFYDGNNDGVYTPIDLNNNGIWDEGEDRPALYGDVMAWSAYNDGVPAKDREIANVNPLGINIRQTTWGYKNIPNLDKVVFIKYSIENTGKVSRVLYDVNFSMATDPNLGYSRNDYLATDSLNNTILTYTPYKDYYLNEEQIALATTLVQGPIVSGSGMAYKLLGEDLEQEKFQDQHNVDIVASVNSRDASFSQQVYQPFSPDFIREVMLGKLNPEPCNMNNAEVYNADCFEITKSIIYSGNPIKQNGWVNTRGSDKEFILTTGSFNLEQNIPVEIIFAFVIGTGDEAVDAMKEALKNSREVKYNFFDKPQTFGEVIPVTITDNETIELLWDDSHTARRISGYGYSIDFAGYEVYMYNSLSTSETINSQPNKKLIATFNYPTAHHVRNLLLESENDFTVSQIVKEGSEIPTYYYKNKKLQKITWDPFNNEPLRKGKPYYFSITPFGIDYSKIIKYGIDGSYLIPANAMYGYFKNEPKIINDDKGNVGIVIGENQNDAYYKGVLTEHKEGNSEAEITYSIYEQDNVTDDLYEVSFERYESDYYRLLLHIQNVNNGSNIFSQIISEDYEGTVNDIRDGFVLNIDWIDPGRVSASFSGEEKWFKEFDNINSGVFYVGSDITESQKVFPVTLNQSRTISIENLSKVELRFADTSKALRYVRTVVRYPWKGKDDIDSGFVKIPVSAYAIDRLGNEKKLSIGFLENGFWLDSLAKPDGIWNPSTSVEETKEYLVIFNNEYTEDLSELIEYTGNSRRAADIANGYLIQATDDLSDSLKAIARSPWFNAMYVVGLSTNVHQTNFNPTGTLTLNPSLVLTENDKYYFRVKKEKTLAEEKEQFNKINVYPNPLFGYNSLSSAYGYPNDEPFVTFSNLPPKVNIFIYSLSGSLIKSISKDDLSASYRWNLKNESEMRVASGLYIAIIEVPEIGQRILKFSIIQPQKQVHY